MGDQIEPQTESEGENSARDPRLEMMMRHTGLTDQQIESIAKKILLLEAMGFGGQQYSKVEGLDESLHQDLVAFCMSINERYLHATDQQEALERAAAFYESAPEANEINEWLDKNVSRLRGPCRITFGGEDQIS